MTDSLAKELEAYKDLVTVLHERIAEYRVVVDEVLAKAQAEGGEFAEYVYSVLSDL